MTSLPHSDLLAWLEQCPLQSLLPQLRDHSPEQMSREQEKAMLAFFLGQGSVDAIRQPIQHRLALYADYTPPPSPSGLLASITREASIKNMSGQEMRAWQDYLAKQSLLHYEDLGTLSWPHRIPSDEEFQRVFALLQAYATAALSLLLVREVIDFLRFLIQNQSLRREHREDARKLLLALFRQLVPSLPKQQPRAQAIDAYLWRRGLLVKYEQEYASLSRILKKRYNNPAARLLTLQEHYPHIPPEQLPTWRANQCAVITKMLVGLPHGLTSEMVDKVLEQAKKERRQRQR